MQTYEVIIPLRSGRYLHALVAATSAVAAISTAHVLAADILTDGTPPSLWPVRPLIVGELA